MPPSILETEGPNYGLHTGRWVLNDARTGYTVTYDNSAQADISVISLTATTGVFKRVDLPGSYSAGLTAIYTGTISADGRTISGTVTLTQPAVRPQPVTEPWSGEIASF